MRICGAGSSVPRSDCAASFAADRGCGDKDLRTLERVKGIEPSYSAWKSGNLAVFSTCTTIPVDTPLERLITADPAIQMIQHDLMLLHKSKLSPTIAADASSRYEGARRLARRWETRQCRSVQPTMGTMQNRPNLLLAINFLTYPVWVAFGPQFR